MLPSAPSIVPGAKSVSTLWAMTFRADSIRRVVQVVDKLNRANRGSDRLVRVHAIGFPVPAFPSGRHPQPASAIKFANLMRELSYNNGGTFIGLNSLN